MLFTLHFVALRRKMKHPPASNPLFFQNAQMSTVLSIHHRRQTQSLRFLLLSYFVLAASRRCLGRTTTTTMMEIPLWRRSRATFHADQRGTLRLTIHRRASLLILSQRISKVWKHTSRIICQVLRTCEFRSNIFMMIKD